MNRMHFAYFIKGEFNGRRDAPCPGADHGPMVVIESTDI